MNIPYDKKHTMPMYDSDSIPFQLTENGVPVTDDLTTQDLKFFIRNHDVDWVNVEKDIVGEGWILDNVEKKFKIVIDTQAYFMCGSTELSRFRCRVEWNDKKLILADFEIEVRPVDFWSDD